MMNNALDDNELERYHQDYAEETNAMTALSVRFTEKGIQQGIRLGGQEAKAELLLCQIRRKFGHQATQTHEA
ncbi:hypothetical protein D5125_15015 [Magnetovirga frankeli]|uniref:hypothetical protein n=1 Tax=Magnetovirga frankeli TaxID=947516 RepID=UPI001294035B|nr:hypothetical protein D5125_15015 [gamma proteobacterium SS-5]